MGRTGFNAGGGGGVAATATAGAAYWAASSSNSARHALNYGAIADMGMVGLRDVFVVAPATHEQILCSSEHPIIPLLAAVDDSRGAVKHPGGIHLFQPPAPQNPNSGVFSAAGGSSTCQDCGNQAKKDCPHRRCRTCCKSRGYDCSTHIKSTWVPAARRRERQLVDTAIAGSSTSTSASKKARLISSQTTTTSHTSTSNTPPRSFDTSSSQQANCRENLPTHVRAPAIFKCVRVTSVDDGEDEYAYQAIVNIGGHVFKGFLYDQGADDLTAATSPVAGPNNNAVPNFSELHLGGAGGRAGGASSSSAMLPSDVYGASAACGSMLGGGGGGAAYGNTIN
ncbi:hypothetical protein KSP39_PZI017554 [Platanthera zijinensis]|uniref:Protein LATERAL ROOT PRIMORDIUM 1 n=1 Tax=Platanthera zijinensis TaxID=2320716 RepID=A0AAP0B5V8_9ASPA